MAIRHDTTAPRSSLWNNDHVGNLDDIDDVTLTGLATNDYLQWNGSAWVNVVPPARHVVMQVGITNPPEPVTNVDGDGWVYGTGL